MLHNLSSKGSNEVTLYRSLSESLGPDFQILLVEKISQYLDNTDLMLAKKYYSLELRSNSIEGEDVDMIDSNIDEQIEYELHRSLENIILSCIPNIPNTNVSKLLNTLITQLETWISETKSLDICDTSLPLQLLQSNLILRIRIISATLDTLRLKEAPERSERYMLLLLRLCDNDIALFVVDGTSGFDLILNILESLLESQPEREKRGKRDNTIAQFDRELKLKLRVCIILHIFTIKDY